MGKIITNRHVIDTPTPASSQRLRYGVFQAASSVLEADSRIIGAGVQYTTDHCGTTVTYDQTCVVSPTKPFDEGSDLVEADPYWVLARKRCGTVGRTAEEALQAARDQLFTGSQTVVESVIWDGGGLAGATPTLTGAGAATVVPVAPGAGAAIAALEEAFYDVSGYVGTIHINMTAYAALRYAGLMDPAERTAGTYRTPMGSVLSIGSGYDITGPAGVAPAAGFVYAFITGPLTIWRSGLIQPAPANQTLDRALNQWDTVAEEVFAHTWDCPDIVFAVQVPVAAPGVSTVGLPA